MSRIARLWVREQPQPYPVLIRSLIHIRHSTHTCWMNKPGDYNTLGEEWLSLEPRRWHWRWEKETYLKYIWKVEGTVVALYYHSKYFMLTLSKYPGREASCHFFVDRHWSISPYILNNSGNWSDFKEFMCYHISQ